MSSSPQLERMSFRGLGGQVVAESCSQDRTPLGNTVHVEARFANSLSKPQLECMRFHCFGRKFAAASCLWDRAPLGHAIHVGTPKRDGTRGGCIAFRKGSLRRN